MTSFSVQIDVARMSALMDRFMATASPDEAQDMVEQHAELLGPDFMWMLDSAIEGALATRTAPAVFALHQRREFLQRCRDVRIAAALRTMVG